MALPAPAATLPRIERRASEVAATGDHAERSDVPLRAPYAPGYTWHRQNEWCTGVEGSVKGNPCHDHFGNPVWHYGGVGEGSDLAGLDPWYTYAAGSATYALWVGVQPSWIAGPRPGAIISQPGATHNNGDPTGVPMVSWRNPLGRSARVEIQGELWVGWFNPAAVEPVDIVVGRRDAGGTATALFTTTLQRGPGEPASQALNIHLPSVEVEAAGEVFFSHRAVRASLGWYQMNDSLEIRLLPSPCPTDFDGDGVTGAADLAHLLGSWGANVGAQDLNGDGMVGSADVAIVLGSWGACPL